MPNTIVLTKTAVEQVSTLSKKNIRHKELCIKGSVTSFKETISGLNDAALPDPFQNLVKHEISC